MTMQHEKRNITILMIIAYIFLLIGVVNSNPMHTTTDELGVIAGAAYFAGLDWSGVISNSGYYGFGYYSLFFWLFKITDSPFIIYRVIITLTVLLRVLIIPIAYSLLKNYLNVTQEKYLYLISFLMPFLYTQTIGMFCNEYALELMTWIIIFLMCKTVSYPQNKKKYFYIVLLIIACFYSLFIHTRALALLIAIGFVYIVVAVIKKNKEVLLAVLGIFLTYGIAKHLVELYQKNIYGLSGNNLRNASVTVSKNFELLSKNTWDVWFHMLIGMIDTETIVTGGFFLVGIVTFICYINHLLVKKKSILSFQGNMILAVSVLCIGAVISAFLVSAWFEDIFRLWGNIDAGNNYVYKGLTYIRYWNIYVPPFMMCTFALLSQMKYRKIINISLGGILAIHFIFISKLIPLIKNNPNCASFMFGVGHYEPNISISKEFYFKCILISLIATFTAYVIIQTKYSKYAVLVCIIFMMNFHYNEQTEYNLLIKKQISSKILASYNMKCQLEQQGVDIGTIYLNDETSGSDNNWKIYSLAQFYFNQYTLQTELPTELKNNDIIICTNISNYIESRYPNINCYVLDDNEVWYTNIESIEKK